MKRNLLALSLAGLLPLIGCASTVTHYADGVPKLPHRKSHMVEADVILDGFKDKIYIQSFRPVQVVPSDGGCFGHRYGVEWGSEVRVQSARSDTPLTVSNPSERTPIDLKVADLNGDGHLDILVLEQHLGNPELGRFVTEVINNGDGTFKPSKSKYHLNGEKGYWPK